ncbi:hypothetical protein [Psychromonas sp. Urea-02u-13]|uniref:hypothetical protein n=1 Tax=Psychromonas sp. Urea-02u-13 TaxID=2058326 RepID=UPI0012FE8F1D|nr:hypothetical protein [Psychromonas sp. Urea-02u-13]
MKKIFHALLWISAIATIVSAGLQLRTPNNEIELKLVSRDLLTRAINVDGLKSSYIYNGEPISKLWQLRYVITNIGSTSIIGSGERSSLIKDHITLKLTSGYKILESSLSSDEFTIENISDNLNLKFLQWKANEATEILLYISQTEEVTAPDLQINEREIIDGTVTRSSLISQESQNMYLYEYLPEIPALFLKWVIIITYGAILLLMPIVIIDTLNKSRKYKNWCKEFMGEVNALVQSQPDLPKDIKNWSNEHWKCSGLVKPKIPKDKSKDTLLGVALICFFLGVPLLFMVSL